MFKIVNGYEDVDRNMFFKLLQTKEGSRTRGHTAALVKVRRSVRPSVRPSEGLLFLLINK